MEVSNDRIRLLDVYTPLGRLCILHKIEGKKNTIAVTLSRATLCGSVSLVLMLFSPEFSENHN